MTYVVFILGFTIIFFLIGNHRYNNSYKKKAHKELHKFLAMQDDRLRERKEKRKLIQKQKTMKLMKKFLGQEEGEDAY